MSKNAKKSTIIIDGKEYKIIEWTNNTETNVIYVPQNSLGEIGSGLHLPENRQRIHWDYYYGNQKIEGKKKYVNDKFKMAPMAIINFKEHQTFLIPPDNQIAVFNGSDKPPEFISLDYYNKNKEKYFRKYSVLWGDVESPQILELNNNNIKCKECGGVVEFRAGVPLNPKFINEYEKDNPRNTICYNCRKKWAEKNLKCKKCGKVIEMHNNLWHDGYCDECFNPSTPSRQDI